MNQNINTNSQFVMLERNKYFLNLYCILKKLARFTDFYSQGTCGRCLPYDAIRICLEAF